MVIIPTLGKPILMVIFRYQTVVNSIKVFEDASWISWCMSNTSFLLNYWFQFIFLVFATVTWAYGKKYNIKRSLLFCYTICSSYINERDETLGVEHRCRLCEVRACRVRATHYRTVWQGIFCEIQNYGAAWLLHNY